MRRGVDRYELPPLNILHHLPSRFISRMSTNRTRSPFTILDGGSATEIVRLGHTYIDGDPLWSAKLIHTNADVIVTMHKNFLSAGSEVVVTTSYQASVPGFTKHLGVSEREAYDLIKKSVELTKQASQEVHEEKGIPVGRVAGSVGPYGAALCDGSEYTGNYIDTISKQEIREWHRPRIQALLEAGVDLLAIETIPAQTEAEVVVQLLEEEFPDAQAWVTFSCKNGSETCHGEKFCDAVESVCQSRNVIAMGINCTDPQYVTSLLKSIQHLHIQKPIIVKPNSGEQWNNSTGWYGKATCTELCDTVLEWADYGATWIGGCCRVYPDDIQKIRDKLQ